MTLRETAPHFKSGDFAALEEAPRDISLEQATSSHFAKAWDAMPQMKSGPAAFSLKGAVIVPTGESVYYGIYAPTLNALALLDQRVAKLQDEVQRLREELARRPLVSSTQLYDLGDSALEVIIPISVILEETEEEALARWPEVGAFGHGDTLAEAVAGVKESIISTFYDLADRNPSTLGRIATDRLTLVVRHIRRGT